MSKKKRLFMQKPQPEADETTRRVRGYLNDQGNVIRFYLGAGVKLAVYRNAQGEWVAELSGLSRG